MKCAVVVPVGPGHEYLAEDSIESVQEAFAKDRGPFSELSVVRIDDTRGLLGRSAARNQGVAEAQSQGAEWLFFLDADDLMGSGAFGVMSGYHADHDALWGLICELTPDEEGYTVRQGQLPSIERMEQVLLNDPTLTLQMGHFVRTEVAVATPFNVALNCGEDFDYYLRVWSQFRCRKIATPLFINRRGFHSTGPRSASGRQWREAVQSIIRAGCKARDLVCEFRCDGELFKFRITDPFDPVQRHFLQGTFFALAELRFLRDRLRKGAAIVDVGANVGNHVVFLSRFLQEPRILALEPDRELVDSLNYNLRANRVAGATINPVELPANAAACGEEPGVTRLATNSANCLAVSSSRALRSETLDAMVRDQVDLIRIDVGGTELEVLQWAREAISRFRPFLLLRALPDHVQALERWCQEHDYRVVRRFDYPGSSSLFLEPARSA